MSLPPPPATNLTMINLILPLDRRFFLQVVIDRVRRSEDADNYMSPLLSEFSELRMAGDGAA